ncbi:WD40-repeat-containing domain protein [Fennellomyces sp. T-0311]|nr:WD40-repeat-containing domain protein [Fennellomyces sp. T-0311]
MHLYPVDDLSPPATPPSSSSSSSSTSSSGNGDHSNLSSGNKSRPSQRLRSSYVDLSMGDNPAQVSSTLDKSRLDYIAKVKTTFLQLSNQQKHIFLSELLNCCDNQLLAFVHTLIAPRLKIDFLKQLPIELALHVLSFIDDPRTLARASRVSLFWNDLLSDESTWKALCLRQYRLLRRPPPRVKNTYRDYFKRKYNINHAWQQGGQTTTCVNNIQEALVTSLQVEDPYIVVGCDNHKIEVFDSITGKHVRTLLGHDGGVWALQFIKGSDGECVLVSGGCDREARVWDLKTGQQRHVLRGHSSTIRCLKMRDTKLAVTGSRDSTLRIWDIEQGTLRHVCMGHTSSVRCLDVHGNKVASGSYDSTARLWSLDTAECLFTFVGHHSQIYAVAYDGKRVITGSLDSNIRVWCPNTGNCLATLQGHTALVGHIQLLPSDPSILVSGGTLRRR